jgi:dihydrofolate reductase
MRKLKLQVQVSIDGFIAGPNHEMHWMKLPWTDDLISYVREITQPVDLVLLGKNLAEGFIPYWSDVAKNPESADYEGGLKYTSTPKIVFSKSLQHTKWENTGVVNGDLAQEITNLKKLNGSDIIAYGGAKFVSSLIKANLIDEYYLMINPTAIGRGMPIFNEITEHLALELAECKKFDCGIAVLKYIRKN